MERLTIGDNRRGALRGDCPLRVLHVSGGVSPKYGGPTRALIELCRMTRDVGFYVGVMVATTIGEDEEVLSEIARHCDSLLSFPRERVHPFAFSWRFSKELEGAVRKYDLVEVHSMWNWAPIAALRVAHKLRIPTVVRPAGALDEFDLQKHALMKRLLGPLFLKKFFEPPNVFHCTAKREAQYLVSFGGRADRVVLALPVTDEPLRSGESRAGARAKLGLGSSARVVVYLGRLNYKKGMELLIPAFAAYHRKNPDAILMIAGDGDSESRDSLARSIADNGLVSVVRRLGFVDSTKKRELLAAGDLLVLPSMNENFGFSIVEALMARMPVVVSPGVYIADEIAGNSAVYIAERTVEGFAGGIEEMMKRRDANPTIGDSARQAWAEHYSPDALWPKYKKFYEGMIRDVSLS